MDHPTPPANAKKAFTEDPASNSTSANVTLAGRDVTAFVLAGGESRRMGRDKALLTLRSGETMLGRALATSKEAAGTVVLVAPAGRYPELQGRVRMIQDVYPGRGPLSGIHAALCVSETEWNIILGVDSPRVTPELLRFLMATAAGTAALAVVPRVEGRLHTVCAVYKKSFAQAAERELLAGREHLPGTGDAFNDPFNPEDARRGSPRRDGDVGQGPRRGTRIERLLAGVPSRILEEDELRDAGFGAELFANVNTPEEFAKLSSASEGRDVTSGLAPRSGKD